VWGCSGGDGEGGVISRGSVGWEEDYRGEWEEVYILWVFLRTRKIMVFANKKFRGKNALHFGKRL
jgi:hypothetical protein